MTGGTLSHITTPPTTYYEIIGDTFVAETNAGGKTYGTGFAVLANGSGLSATMWQSAPGSTASTDFYLLPDKITHYIVSSSGAGGWIEVWDSGVIDSGTLLQQTTDDVQRYFDAPNGKDVTYKMTPKPGYIIDKLYLDGAEVQATAVKDAGGRILYYTYTVPGTMPDNTTIHVTWQPSVDVKVVKVWDDENDAAGLRPGSLDVELLVNGSTMSGSAVTLNDGNAWAHTYIDLPKNGITYSVSEALNDPNYEEVTPHAVTNGIEYRTGLDGSTYPAETQVHTVTNRIKSADLTIEKKVAGNMGDRSKDWTFTVKLISAGGTAITGLSAPAGARGWTELGGGEYSFLLSHGDIASFSLPIGTKFTFTETGLVPGEYEQFWQYTGSGAATGHSETTGEVTLRDGNTQVIFENARYTAVPTGLRVDAAPVLAGALIALGLLAFLAPGRRRKRYG